MGTDDEVADAGTDASAVATICRANGLLLATGSGTDVSLRQEIASGVETAGAANAADDAAAAATAAAAAAATAVATTVNDGLVVSALACGGSAADRDKMAGRSGRAAANAATTSSEIAPLLFALLTPFLREGGVISNASCEGQRYVFV
jgi:hypothetical protein